MTNDDIEHLFTEYLDREPIKGQILGSHHREDTPIQLAQRCFHAGFHYVSWGMGEELANLKSGISLLYLIIESNGLDTEGLEEWSQF